MKNVSFVYKLQFAADPDKAAQKSPPGSPMRMKTARHSVTTKTTQTFFTPGSLQIWIQRYHLCGYRNGDIKRKTIITISITIERPE